MITLMNSQGRIKIHIDKSVLPEEKWDNYKCANIYKSSVALINLEINDNNVIIHFINGLRFIMTFEDLNTTAHPTITDNEALCDLLVLWVDEYYAI